MRSVIPAQLIWNALTNFFDRHAGKKIRDGRPARKLASPSWTSAVGSSATKLEEDKGGGEILPARQATAVSRYRQAEIIAFFDGAWLGHPENRICPDISHPAP